MVCPVFSSTVRGVNPQVDGNGGDASISPGDAVGLSLDLLTDLIEIGELLPFAVQELGPLCRVETTCEHHTDRPKDAGCGTSVCTLRRTCVCTDELQNQRPASDDAGPTGQKIPGKHTDLTWTESQSTLEYIRVLPCHHLQLYYSETPVNQTLSQLV